MRLVVDLQAYYDRKVGEGKPKLLVLNGVRHKLQQRVYSCVGDMRTYPPAYVAVSRLPEGRVS